MDDIMAKRSLFSRLRAAVKTVTNTAADFLRPEVEPPPPPRVKRPDVAAILVELAELESDGNYHDGITLARATLKHYPNHAALKAALARLIHLRDNGGDLFEQMDLELDPLTKMEPGERDNKLQQIQKDNILGILRAEDVPLDVIRELDEVEDWSDHFSFEVDHNGLISSPKQGAEPGDRHDVFVGSAQDCATQMAFWAEQGEIFKLKITPLAAKVDNWRPLYEGESVATLDGGARGTMQGEGKRKPHKKRGRPAKSHGQHTSESWRQKQNRESSRKSRARKSAEKLADIFRTEGKQAAHRFQKKVDNARRAAAARKSKK